LRIKTILYAHLYAWNRLCNTELIIMKFGIGDLAKIIWHMLCISQVQHNKYFLKRSQQKW
jgi:hypothetical protein